MTGYSQVAGLAENRVLDLSEALARSSLIQFDSTQPGWAIFDAANPAGLFSPAPNQH